MTPSDGLTAVSTRFVINKGNLLKILNSLLSTSHKFAKVEGKWVRRVSDKDTALLGVKRKREVDETSTSMQSASSFEYSFEDFEGKVQKLVEESDGDFKMQLSSITAMLKDLSRELNAISKVSQVERKVSKLELWIRNIKGKLKTEEL